MLWAGREYSPHRTTFSHVVPSEGVVSPRTRHKVCIFGGASSEEPLPMMRDDYEIWGCNAMWGRGLDALGRIRADRWFELHPLQAQTHFELESMRECGIPLYVLPGGLEWAGPSAVLYPLSILGKYGHRYFTSTFAYQVALAMAEGFTTIRLCNIWLDGGRELCVERACLEFWLGVCVGSGIMIEIPKTSSLLHHPYLYGVEYYEEKAWVEQKLRNALTSIARDGFGGSQ